MCGRTKFSWELKQGCLKRVKDEASPHELEQVLQQQLGLLLAGWQLGFPFSLLLSDVGSLTACLLQLEQQLLLLGLSYVSCKRL